MEEIYYNSKAPGSYSGEHSFRRYARSSRRAIVQFLREQPAYTLHRSSRKKFRRRRTFAKGIDDLFQADLTDLTSLSSHNDSYRYLLTCIDVFSRFAWAVPLRTKSAREVTSAFEQNILNQRKCRMLQTDKGTEFYNDTFQNMLSKHSIHHYSSENDDIKAALVERFNRTLKERLYRYFTRTNSKRYLDVLEDVVFSYNNTYHRSIGMSPSQVSRENERLVAARLYPQKAKTYKWKFDVNDVVRIIKSRQRFQKGYLAKWSEEMFVVVGKHPTDPVTYSIRDMADQAIKGRFYDEELQKVVKPSDDFYIVEKIVKTRRRNGRIQYLVKWRGYPESCNSWTDELKHI